MSETQQQVIARAAAAAGIPAELLWGEYGEETDYGQNDGPSTAGAVGPFQFEPATAASLGINPYNFTEAAYGAATYLAQAKKGGVAAMTEHYNPGGGTSYLDGVLEHAKTWAGGKGATALPATTTATASTSSGGLSGWLSGLLDKGALYIALLAGAAGAMWFGLKFLLQPAGAPA